MIMAQEVESRTVTIGESLIERYIAIRSFTATLCETLSAEDCCLQSMANASPVRWHLAHTSWFFETFLLGLDPQYRVFDEHYEVLFNSYYNAVGEQFPRDQRGLLSRPDLDETYAYREYVDEAMLARLQSEWPADGTDVAQIVELGIQHEQQHQELILTDLKHLFSKNPLFPVYRDGERDTGTNVGPMNWSTCDEGIHEIGYVGEGFSFDNELPRHRVFLERYKLANRLVTSEEYLEFVEDGGYSKPELWLALGWDYVNREGWEKPPYWYRVGDEWHEFTLAGLQPLDLAAPVSHVSYFEADAFARWAGARLPTETEWEVASNNCPTHGNFADKLIADSVALHPNSSGIAGDSLAQMFGDAWEWTASSYSPYPGYSAPPGALGEYNGKFMCNQYVLRGGSVATSSTHIRPTYRNFFSPESRWQFAGIRLAK
ncbi:MAG: ergothioneine biosynthesis protein EgtB [Planctomycetota bacterium]